MAKIQDQKFFFIVDLSNLSIIHANGISDWLGYDNETFTLSFYPTIVHPNHLDAMLFLGKSITEVVKSRKIEVGFMKEKFTIDIALKHADGHYILVRRALSYWDFDANMQMPTAYINEFSILENFEEEYSPGIRPRTTDFNNNRVKYFEEALRESSCNLLEKEKKFSVQELRILRRYAHNKNLDTKEIASAFKISIRTAETHNKNIIVKYNDFFPSHPLKSVKEIALFMRLEYLI
jgi:DNA-binding CsgD family transcriptional regulator